MDDPLMLYLFGKVNCEPQPDFEQWSAALALALADDAESNVSWLWYVIDEWPSTFVTLSPWMPELAGMFPPGAMGWPEWIRNVHLTPADIGVSG